MQQESPRTRVTTADRLELLTHRSKTVRAPVNSSEADGWPLLSCQMEIPRPQEMPTQTPECPQQKQTLRTQMGTVKLPMRKGPRKDHQGSEILLPAWLSSTEVAGAQGTRQSSPAGPRSPTAWKTMGTGSSHCRSQNKGLVLPHIEAPSFMVCQGRWAEEALA